VTRRERDLKRRLLALAEPFGASVDIKRTGGGHLCATFKHGVAHIDVYLAWSPSDYRAEKNAAAFVRRTLRTIQA
jgi:hypothetical protein